MEKHFLTIVLSTLCFHFWICKVQSTGTEMVDYSECGIKEKNGKSNSPLLKIIGGSESIKNQWPWMVYITGPQGPLVCGGTLISGEWVLTSASCLPVDEETLSLKVFLGRHSRDGPSDNPHEIEVNVRQIFIHPGYPTGLYDNDVALLQLNRTINFTKYIRPACLVNNGTNTDDPRDEHSFTNDTCVVLGWGLITNDGSPTSLSRTLQELNVRVYNETACDRIGRFFVTLGGSKICVGGERGKGTCSGDGGGPLLCQHDDDKYYVHGINSVGAGCANGFPDFFIEVGYPTINTWIRNTIR